MEELVKTLVPLTRRLAMHGKLDVDDESAVLALPHTVRKLEPAQFIVREGDVATHSCLVLAGFAIRHKVTNDGSLQILNFHMSGDMVDLQNSLLTVSDHNVQALGPLEAAFIPRDAIVELAFDRPAVGKALWMETLVEGSISREWIMNVGRRDAAERLAHLLCEFAYRLNAVGLGKNCRYELPMTQEQLADATGMTSIHVNRTLKVLESGGLIQRSRRSGTINNLEKLADFSDFRSLYLHFPPRALPDHVQ
jgi:CRP-like cAMP-binding protein